MNNIDELAAGIVSLPRKALGRVGGRQATTLPPHPAQEVLGGKESPSVTIYRKGAGYIAGPTVRPRMSFLEKDEQAAFVGWLRQKGLRHHSVPNSAARSSGQGAELKRQGLVPGVPDIYVFLPGIATLAIEMKRESGVLSDVDGMQWDWFEGLALQPGWLTCIAFGKNSAVGFVEAVWRNTGNASLSITSN